MSGKRGGSWWQASSMLLQTVVNCTQLRCLAFTRISFLFHSFALPTCLFKENIYTFDFCTCRSGHNVKETSVQICYTDQPLTSVTKVKIYQHLEVKLCFFTLVDGDSSEVFPFSVWGICEPNYTGDISNLLFQTTDFINRGEANPKRLKEI